MITTSLPPQAYTRDTLVKAVEWWNQQPTSLKERATSADAIVSFYLQACRRASASQEAPLSGEAFKADLKNLAQGLKQFEERGNQVAPPPTPRSFAPQASVSTPTSTWTPPLSQVPLASLTPVAPPTPVAAPAAFAPPAPPVAHAPAPAAPAAAPTASSAAMAPHYAPPPQPATYYAPPQPVAPVVNPPPVAPPPPPPSAPPQAVHAQSHVGVMVWNVDLRSAQAAKELQNRLNLGTEIEALRLLITLGMERARSLFP